MSASLTAMASGQTVRRRAGAAGAPGEEGGSVALTFVEPDAEGNSQVYLFTSPPPSDLYCPLSSTILKDPLLSPHGHTFSAEAIKSYLRAHGKCPITGQPMNEAQLTPNLLARTLVEELEVHCPYGVRLSRSRGCWVEDEDGCPDTFKLALRKAKIKACKYRPMKCPYGGRKCGMIPRIDLEYHVQEECQHLHNQRRGRDPDGDRESGMDTLEVLTILMVWSLLIFGLYQTQLFGKLLRDAYWPITILMGIPVSLTFFAIVVELFINSSSSGGSADSDDEDG